MDDDLGTYAENTWCPGCGNFGILNAFKKAVHTVEEKGIGRDHIVISSGIGCHAKIFDYLALNGLYSLHGRATATVQGIKIANPDLKVVAFSGDGDGFGEGIAHLIFAAKRNSDMTLIIHDNGVYGLTTGQFTPTSEKGFKGPSSPKGSVEDPLNPLVLMLVSGATFVARGYPGKLDHLADLMAQAIMHKGFAFIQVLQPCVSFNNTYKRYNELVEVLASPARDIQEAIRISERTDRLPIGVIFRTKGPVFHEELYGDWNPVTRRQPMKDRLERIRALVSR
jgi:2-oxoglutarate ferredoxin oxidoreductase subunit beta